MQVSGGDAEVSSLGADAAMTTSDTEVPAGEYAAVAHEITVVSDVVVPDEPTPAEALMDSETHPVSVEELQHLAGDSDIKVYKL